MAHHTVKAGYSALVDRLNRFPQGAPSSDVLYEILKMLFSEREAGLAALLPLKPFKAEKAAKVWRMSEPEAEKILDELASRAILLDTVTKHRKRVYVLPPPMAGFFEFSMMRVREDIDQKVLSELFYQYLNVEEEFIKDLFVNGETNIGRTFVQETALPSENGLHVLDYERASEVIKTARYSAIGICYCRHKMQHVQKDCDAPKEICMTFSSVAKSLVNHGYGREADAVEGLDLLQQAQEQNLVQFGENVRQRIGFICNCCGCCCEAMITARKFGLLNPVHTSNFIPQINNEECNGCGKCVNVCPVEAMSVVSANDPTHPRKRKARLDEKICLGCGVCVRNCSTKAISLKARPERVITPITSTHRTVLMAIERGKLQNLIFENQALKSHRAMAAILGVILKLPPVKQVMASRQMKSRYLERMLG